MASVRINTGSVINAAANIQKINRQIRDGFPRVQAAVTQLNNAWEGSAAACAAGKFNEIKARFPDARYRAVDNYANFLLQQVGAGYDQTEEANKSLAAAFK